MRLAAHYSRSIHTRSISIPILKREMANNILPRSLMRIVYTVKIIAVVSIPMILVKKISATPKNRTF